MPDYIPSADPAFNSWQGNFVTYANANLATVGLATADMTPLLTAQTAWSTAYSSHISAQASAQSAAAAKEGARKAYEMALRALVLRIQTNPVVTDARRAALGIPIRSKSKTPAGAPTTRPVVTVDTSQRLRHVISFKDESAPGRKARPAGVLGAEIWVKVGDAPPVDGAECTFLALDTATPYLAEYPGAKAGQKAHYMLRWVSTRGEKGPWSDVVSATIVG